MLAALEGIKFEPKELVDNWILLTYDLPAGKVGGAARYQFLKQVPKLGAVMHTSSVYLIPWSEQAEIAALQVTKAGQAFLWTAQVKEEEKQKELTELYDSTIKKRIDDIYDRIKRIKEHQSKGEDRPANRMIKKTGELLEDIVTAATRRNSITMLSQAITLYKELLKLNEES